MKFVCKTYFDITPTGITGHYKSSHVPFKDRAGQTIQNEISWNLARNQQRNWETLTQVIGLRTQVYKLTDPVRIKDMFEFTFETESIDALGPADDPVKMLVADAQGVPMIAGLWNVQDIEPVLTVTGPRQNIWFTTSA